MDKQTYNYYWESLPIGRENAVTYEDLCFSWGVYSDRLIRKILHELQTIDNGDNYILIRSGRTNGFYKTDNIDEIAAYKAECLNKGRSVFTPITKINRVMCDTGNMQMSFDNNLRAVRESKGLKQKEVCEFMKKNDECFDCALLSKMENSRVLPTPYQLNKLSKLYGVNAALLIDLDYAINC